MILKIIPQVLAYLVTFIIAILDYTWRDRRTRLFKRTRYALYLVLFLSLIANSFSTYYDDQEKKKEIAVLTSSLKNISDENTDLKNKIENITNELTGGDSFCYFVYSPPMYMSNSEPRRYNDAELWLMHSGSYPLSNISVRLVDLQKFHQLLDERSKSPTTLDKFNAAIDTNFIVPKLDPEHKTFIAKLELPANVNKYAFNAFFDVRQGRWVQELRFLRTKDGHWGLASRTRRGDKVLQEDGSGALPKDDSGKTKWD